MQRPVDRLRGSQAADGEELREEALVDTAPGLIRLIDPVRVNRIDSEFAL